MHGFKFAVSSLAVLFSLNVFAANVPPGFNQGKWDQLIAKAVAKGAVVQTPSGELRFLTQGVATEPAPNHYSRYLSVMGNYNEQQEFVAEEASSVDEDWRMDDKGIWTVDQWIYHIALNGDLTAVNHNRIVEQNGQVLDYQDLKAGAPTDAQELQRWGAQLDYWTSLP